MPTAKAYSSQADKADNKIQRRALLLHSAGEAVQEIFETLADIGEAKDYEKAGEGFERLFYSKGKFDIPKSLVSQHGTTGR